METLTGLPGKDDWDFVFNGYSNTPFIKTKYPHHSGTWSWGSQANEVMLAVQFKRRSLVEYADVTWYQVWARTYNSERKQVKDRYGDRKPLNGELAHVSSYSMCLSFSNRNILRLKTGTGGGMREYSKKSIAWCLH